MPSVSATLGRREPEVVVEHENRPLLGRQPSEAAIDLVAIGQAAGLVGTRRSVDRQHPDVRRPFPGATSFLVAGVDEDPVEPHVESVWVAQTRQLPPGVHEGLLDGVLRPAGVVEDPQRDGVEPVGVHAGEGAERVSVASSRLLDDRPVHRSLSIVRARRGRGPRLQMGRGPGAFNPAHDAFAPVMMSP
jgi:hypothetical protein